MTLATGVRLGPYEINGPLGAGGMGEVYRAKDSRLNRTVAIKVLPPDAAGDADRRERFEREAKAISALDHPHTCPLYDVGEHDGTYAQVPSFGNPYRSNFDVTADGKRFLINTASETGRTSPITVVLNWTTALANK